MQTYDLAVYSPAIGIASKYLVDWMRKSPNFKWLKPEDTKKVLAFVAIVSASCTLLTSILTGNVTPDLLSSGIEAVVSAIFTFTSAVAYHEATK